MKLTNNTQKLLVILILMLGLIVTMFGIGVLTRTSVDPFETKQMTIADLYGYSCENIKTYLYSSVVRLRTDLYEAQLNYIVAKYREKAISELTAETVYTNYAYEISKFHYPEIDANYVCAIMWHESRFDPTVTNSKSGTRGLTQISPKWHTKRAESLGVTDLYEPYGNILVCFDILNELTERYGFEYALNFYAGGYKYANDHSGHKSQFVQELEDIMNTHNFPQQVLPYSITENGGVLNG